MEEMITAPLPLLYVEDCDPRRKTTSIIFQIQFFDCSQGYYFGKRDVLS